MPIAVMTLVLILVVFPTLDQVAQCMLRSEDVVLVNFGATYSFPEPFPPETYTFHIDQQETWTDREARPYRGTASLWL
eukprot:SAG31_NODE_20676_length_568_cov_0.769723_2_plen_77_part_01